MNAVPETFGSRLRRHRVALGWTQEELAERASMSPAAVAALERGRRQTPRLTTVRALAAALGLASADLADLTALAGSTEPPPRPPPAEPVALETAAEASRPLATGNLPAALAPIVGREVELAGLDDELVESRLVTLLGPGGVGKTRLAQQVAQRQLDKRAGGVWWVELATLAAGSTIGGAVLAALRAPEATQRDTIAQIVAVLANAGGPVLVVLDNCEHVVDDAAALAEALLARVATLTIVATSRDPLRVAGEVVWSVPPLAAPPEDEDVELLGEWDAVRLFVERAGRARRGYRLSDEVAPIVAAICRRLDGLPLALELAASRLGALTEAEIAAQLDDRFAFTGLAPRSSPERHRALFACVEWSYGLLDDDERRLLLALGTFAGTFSGEAAAALGDPGGGPVLDVLARLVDKSLVVAERGRDGRSRYRMLETIRAYAQAKAAEKGELGALRDAHAAYHATWLEEIGAAEPDDETIAAIAERYPDVRSALQWSVQQGSLRAARMVSALGSTWFLLSWFNDAIVAGDAALALASASPADRATWARTVGALGVARLLAGDAAFVSEQVPRALAVALELGDTHLEGQCRLVLGMRPPFDLGELAAAHDLGVATGTELVAGVAAGMYAIALGPGSESDAWLARTDAAAARVGNVSLDGLGAIARCDQLFDLGRLAEAGDLAERYARDERVTLTVRLLHVGRLVMVALQRLDRDVGERAALMGLALTRVWNPVGFPGVDLATRRLALLGGERPPTGTVSDHTSHLGVQPPAVRILCRTAIDRGERLDPRQLAARAGTATSGPLVEASVESIVGAHAWLDERFDEADRAWRRVLSIAADHGYLLLAVDALEALAGLDAAAAAAAVPTVPTLPSSRATRAGHLTGAAESLRDATDNRFRFTFEQRTVDDGAVRGAAVLGEAGWAAAVAAGRSLDLRAAQALLSNDDGA